MKSSSFARGLELARLVTQVGLQELRSGDLKSRIEQAALITRSLSNLKGAAMKAGQLLSLDLNHYFPPEAIAILSQLQDAATALPYEDIEKILIHELGSQVFQQMKPISQSPIGVASIGQVHQAHWSDQKIALKVQYPQVADSIESDLKILKSLAVSFCQLTGRQMDLNPLFAEFKHLLQQEVDYVQEAKLQTQYMNRAQSLHSDSGFNYRVPTVIPELSTSKVLGMTFEKGISLRSWIASKPDLKNRNDLAFAFLDLYFHEFFQWGLVQTDPNWANFLVEENQDGRNLVLLDFGAVRTYSRDFIKNYCQLLQLASSNKSYELKDHAIEFGLIDRRESAAAFAAFEIMMKTALKPFFPTHTSSEFFDFADPEHSLDSQNSSKALSKELVYSPPPYNIVFLHRKLAGIYSILKSLEVKIDVSGYWHKMQDLSAEKK